MTEVCNGMCLESRGRGIVSRFGRCQLHASPDPYLTASIASQFGSNLQMAYSRNAQSEAGGWRDDVSEWGAYIDSRAVMGGAVEYRFFTTHTEALSEIVNKVVPSAFEMLSSKDKERGSITECISDEDRKLVYITWTPLASSKLEPKKTSFLSKMIFSMRSFKSN
jgi:hypothetical protein